MIDEEPTPVTQPALPPSLGPQSHPVPPPRRGSSLPYIIGGSITAVAVAIVLLLLLSPPDSDQAGPSSPARIQVNEESDEGDDAPAGPVVEAPDADETTPEGVAEEEAEVIVETLPPITESPLLVGDLGLAQAIQNPICEQDDPARFVVIAASLTDPTRFAADTQAMLTSFPGSAYLRTDATGCTSLRQDFDGAAIYAVYYGPYATRAEACSALAAVARGSYIKPLQTGGLAPSINRSDC